MPPDGAAEIRRLVAGAEDVKTEPPRPLFRELPPADPFPVDALGDVLASAARAIHDRVRAPIAIGAQSVLGAAVLATQGHADVELPIGNGSAKPVSCYFVTVAATGERKSESDWQALWPVEKHEAALRASHDADLFSYANAKAAWDKARDLALKTGKGDQAAIRAVLDSLGKAPNAPLEPMLTCPEPTFEGLCKLFAIGWPSLGIFAPEGGQFIGGHGMSQENKLKTAAGLSAAWDGKPIRRVRSGDGATILPGRRLSVHLMAQPAVADLLSATAYLPIRACYRGFYLRRQTAQPAPVFGARNSRRPIAISSATAPVCSAFSRRPCHWRRARVTSLRCGACRCRGRRADCGPRLQITSRRRLRPTASWTPSRGSLTSSPSTPHVWPQCSR
jgi:Protein of unknown function (DUF3987)